MIPQRTPEVLVVFLSAVLFVAGGLRGQTGETAPPPAQANPGEQSRGATIDSLFASIRERRALIRTRQEELAGKPETEQTAAKAEIATLQAELAKLETDLEKFATGIDPAEFEKPTRQRFVLLDEVVDLIRPVVQGMKSATEVPREISDLEHDIDQLTARYAMAQQAREALRKARAAAGGAVAEALDGIDAAWTRRETDARNRLTIARDRLRTLKTSRVSVFESAGDLFGSFYRRKGRNLLWAAGAFLLVFFGLGFLSRPIRTAANRRRGGGTRLGAQLRVLRVLFQLGALALATVAALMVLYAADDWTLLGIALLFLLGLAWASKQALPVFFEQTRLLLNVGAVREGERVVLGGVPWRVQRIGVFSYLVNPVLTGGLIRVSIREMIGLRSRPVGDQELWFPTREGDWVIADGVRGKVVSQTPDLVQLVKLGGARVTYQTGAFLALNPTNLSTGFRVTAVFGVDYRHQRISTAEIPRIMQREITARLGEMLGEEAVVNIKVELQAAGASSLDYAVLADIRGESAARYEAIQRAIQATLVDACNDNGWVIPFTQLTVHQAAG